MSASEIAKLRRQIEQEYQAALSGLSGFASGMTSHTFINKRMSNLTQLHKDLIEQVGKEQAIDVLAHTIWSPAELGGTHECTSEKSRS